MAMTVTLNINPNLLIWAISRAGFDLDKFIAANPKIGEWLTSKKKPTIKQLEAFSKKVHVPFGYLFLPEAPKDILPIPFFRTNADTKTPLDVNVYDTILLLQQRQDWLRDYLHDNDFEPLLFVGKFQNKTNHIQIASDIRETLGLPHEWASAFKTWTDALQHLTEKIEQIGIIVIFNGVVDNNTKRPIEVDDCRGFVLVDRMAPFMFVNNSDSKSAQLFTIVHELAHIWTGHSAGFDFRKLQPANDPIEVLCDKIAAEFLVPEKLFKDIWDEYGEISVVARHFKVSEIVIARRALDLGKITKKTFFNFYDEYSKREFKKKEEKKGGGDFYRTAKVRLSLTYAAHINQAVRTGQLLYRDAYKLTSLKGNTYQTFFSKHSVKK